MTEQEKNYEQTLVDVLNASKIQNIPFKSIQYDSYWYGAEKGYRQGSFLWNGSQETDKFPHGLDYVYKKMNLPVTAHNKFWDHTVRYAKQNGGSYNFAIDSFTFKALPNDTNFWDDLFANSTKWGLKTYEQVYFIIIQKKKNSKLLQGVFKKIIF